MLKQLGIIITLNCLSFASMSYSTEKSSIAPIAPITVAAATDAPAAVKKNDIPTSKRDQSVVQSENQGIFSQISVFFPTLLDNTIGVLIRFIYDKSFSFVSKKPEASTASTNPTKQDQITTIKDAQMHQSSSAFISSISFGYDETNNIFDRLYAFRDDKYDIAKIFTFEKIAEGYLIVVQGTSDSIPKPESQNLRNSIITQQNPENTDILFQNNSFAVVSSKDKGLMIIPWGTVWTTEIIPGNFIEFLQTASIKQRQELEEAIGKGIKKAESILGKNWQLVSYVGKPAQTEDVVYGVFKLQD